jgi:hypothetical protein
VWSAAGADGEAAVRQSAAAAAAARRRVERRGFMGARFLFKVAEMPRLSAVILRYSEGSLVNCGRSFEVPQDDN